VVILINQAMEHLPEVFLGVSLLMEVNNNQLSLGVIILMLLLDLLNNKVLILTQLHF